jgi:hypothetical protein
LLLCAGRGLGSKLKKNALKKIQPPSLNKEGGSRAQYFQQVLYLVSQKSHALKGAAAEIVLHLAVLHAQGPALGCPHTVHNMTGAFLTNPVKGVKALQAGLFFEHRTLDILELHKVHGLYFRFDHDLSLSSQLLSN